MSFRALLATYLAFCALALNVAVEEVVGERECNGTTCGDHEDKVEVSLLQASLEKDYSIHTTKASAKSKAVHKHSMLGVRHLSNKSKTKASSFFMRSKRSRSTAVTPRERAHGSRRKSNGKKQQPITETSNQSWLERLGNAFFSVLFGAFVLIPFSIALLWINEKRNAKLESLISLGSSEAETIETSQTKLRLDDYDGTLVHMNDGEAKGLDPVKSKHFKDSVIIPKGCLRLRTVAEAYQWQEKSHSTTQKDNIGGGKTTQTTYEYEQGWFPVKIDSRQFKCNEAGPSPGASRGGPRGHSSAGASKQQERHNNIDPDLATLLATDDVFNETVKYGDHYYLPKEMTSQLSNFQDASVRFGPKITFKSQTKSHTFERGNSTYFFCPREQPHPKIGDFRVKIEYVPDGPATILALQSADKQHPGGHTFKPYRAVSRGCCKGYTDDDLKKLRVKEADKDMNQLYDQDKCWDWGPFACLCCCCNLVLCCFSAVAPPQIYSAWRGKKTKQDCLKAETSKGVATKWCLRLLGWLLLWAGTTMLFAPLEVILDIIPFLGPYLGSGLSWVLGFATFLITLVVATLLVALAYLTYHPLLGLCYLSFVAAIVVGISFLADALDNGELLQLTTPPP